MNLQEFYEALASIKNNYQWAVQPNGLIRGNRCICPIEAVGGIDAETKSYNIVMEAFEKVNLNGYTETCIVNTADRMKCSPWYDASVRERLLEILGLEEST